MNAEVLLMKSLILLTMLFFQSQIYASNCAKDFSTNNSQALEKGKAVNVNKIKKKAIEGDASSQLEWGLMNLKGDKVPQDYKEAYHWIKKSAEQDFLKARAQLGLMYANGIGVPQNKARAFRILSQLYDHPDFKNSLSK